ncbi:MAG TPA: class I SAM-dependent methyltransferase, partial [Nitrososphaera sp.]|nr:class I SAM-dependent methyltransferase [Nitrososphaera sp.]
RHLVSRKESARILDIGSSDSDLAKALESFADGKWQVYGVDIKGKCDALMDARMLAFGDETFDQVVCVSTVEHVGLGSAEFDKQGDIRTMREISRVLKNGGRLVLTVPFGVAPTRAVDDQRESLEIANLPTMKTRIYNSKTLASLVEDYSIEASEFYRYFCGRWKKCSESTAMKAAAMRDATPIGFHSGACACLLLRKAGS